MNPYIVFSIVVSFLALVMFLGRNRSTRITHLVSQNNIEGEKVFYIIVNRARTNFCSKKDQIEYLLLRYKSIDIRSEKKDEILRSFDLSKMRNLCIDLYFEFMSNLNADLTAEQKRHAEQIITEESIKVYIKKRLKKNRYYKICLIPHELSRFAIEYVIANKELKLKEAIEKNKKEEEERFVKQIINKVKPYSREQGYSQEANLTYCVIKCEKDIMAMSKKEQTDLKRNLGNYDRVAVYFILHSPNPIIYEIIKSVNGQYHDPSETLIQMLENLLHTQCKVDSAIKNWSGPGGFVYSQINIDGEIDVINSFLTFQYGPDAARIICLKCNAIKHLFTQVDEMIKKHIYYNFIYNKAHEAANRKQLLDLICKLNTFSYLNEDKLQFDQALISHETLKTNSKNFLDCINDLDHRPEIKFKGSMQENVNDNENDNSEDLAH